MISVKTLILAPIYGFGLVVSGVMAYAVGPSVEEQVFPVITNQSVSDPTRTDDRACWQWTYHKARAVTLLRKNFYVERDDGVRFPVAEQRPDLGIPSNDSTTAEKGVTRTIPECVFVPAAVRLLAHFTVHGRNVYRPFHGLWDLDQPVMSTGYYRTDMQQNIPHDSAPVAPDSDARLGP